MKNAFIFHGVGGHPGENWFPFLKNELEKSECKVIVPQFPTPKNQNLENWLEVLKQYEDLISPQTIFVGHSLGVPFTLNLLEEYKIKAAFLVAGFIGVAGNEFDDSMKTFAQRTFNWNTIKENCQRFKVYHSDNDPYIKTEKAHELCEKLGVQLNLIKNAGHFNTAAGYTEFALLLEDIKKEL